jgi:23S rRNA (guanosine2251-2'-O)-methyltransferase
MVEPGDRSGGGGGRGGRGSRSGGRRGGTGGRGGGGKRVARQPGSALEASPRAQVVGGEQIEGRRAVRELLAAGRRPVREVWLAEAVDDAPILDQIAGLAAVAGVTLRRVARSRLTTAARTEAPQGVLAWAAPLADAGLERLAAQPVGGPGGPAPFLLVLDGVTDPHNLGALLRSAECAGATGAVLPRHRSAHVTPTVAKAAAGAIEYLQFAVVPGVPAALASLAGAGVWTVGLDADAPASLWSLEVATEPIALVLGGEGHGLSRLTRQRCDVLVSIPQRGAIDSLNVAAAGALACFEVARRRGN